MSKETTLAQRLGRTVHVSPLGMKLRRVWSSAPSKPDTLEDWLVDVANARGARIVVRANATPLETYSRELTNEELVTGLLLTQNLDRPQMLRLHFAAR